MQNKFLNIYSNEDERLTYLGSVFHNKKSRAMWILLTNNSDRAYYLKEMAVIIENENNPRLPIYEHHIKNMIKSGLVITTKKMHNKHPTNFYRAAPITTIISSMHSDDDKNQKLSKFITKLYQEG